MVEQPGQGEAQRVGVVEALDRNVARLDQRIIQGLGGPRMIGDHIRAHGDRVHDREDLGLAVIGLLDLLEVRPQPLAIGRTIQENFRQVDREQCVDFARLHHGFKRLAVWQEFEADARRRCEGNQRRLRGRVEPAHEPAHLMRCHAIFVLDHALHEHGRRRAPLRGADAFSPQVLRLFDAGARADVDARMTEDLRHGNRQRAKAGVATAQKAGVGGQRQFRSVELLVFQHARKHHARPQHLDLEVYAMGPDAPVDERAGAVIVPAREGELEIGHADTFRSSLRAKRSNPSKRPSSDGLPRRVAPRKDEA